MLDDLVTPYATLHQLYNLYACQSDKLNWFLSPIHADLAQFPPTRLVAGTKDGFYGDCLQFAEKLVGTGTDVRVKVMDGMIHAALNFNTPSILPQADGFRDETFALLQELSNK